MNLDSHKRTLGIIHLITGILSAVFLLALMSLLSSFLPIILDEIIEPEKKGEIAITFVSQILKFIFIFLILFNSLPSIIGGIGLLQKKDWGMVITFVAGIISLLNFPIGTAIGVYTIYVFVEHNKSKKEELPE